MRQDRIQNCECTCFDFDLSSMATHDSTATAHRRALAPAGLEVLTDVDQHRITARAAPRAPTDWGSKLSQSTSRSGSWDSDVLVSPK